MKSPLRTTLGLLALWWLGASWSISWIDRQSLDDVPGTVELSAARRLWGLTPATDVLADADRALKFSWIRTAAAIHRKERKTAGIVRVLTEEFQEIAHYIEAHNESLSPDVRSRAAAQLLTYINRIELFQRYSSPALEWNLAAFASKVSSAPMSIQEDWYREMMIRGHMRGDSTAYRQNLDRLLSTLRSRRADVPHEFLEGVASYYEGVLLCVAMRPLDALVHLVTAARKLSAYPEDTTRLLNRNLNVLLLGKVMDSEPGCRDSLVKVVSSGS